MKRFLFAICLSFIFLNSYPQNNDAAYTPAAENLAARADFQNMKFGMFIHWGASSVLGSGEWVMNQRNIRVPEYNRLINIFNPISFDAKKWVEAAKNGGMKYITFITRHHDGFSNWDTKQSDWKITNTAYGKDAVKQLADECHKQGIKIFFYYSLLDWYRSDYQYETGSTGKGTGRTKKSDWNSYINFMKQQLTELLTNYGEVAGIWFDGHWDQMDNDHGKKQSKVDWHYNEIYGLIHKLQPKCMIANNHHLATIPGEDFQTFEKDLPGANASGFSGQATISQLPLETCETMNNSWGFNITDRSYKTAKTLIHYMVNAAGRNANFLLNVGPMPNGVIQPEFVDTLKIIGTWLEKNGESIYETRGNIIAPQDWGVVTGKDKILYVHILKRPQESYIFIPALKAKVISASTLADKKKINFKQLAEGVFVYVDPLTLNDTDEIIRLQIQ